MKLVKRLLETGQVILALLLIAILAPWIADEDRREIDRQKE